MAAAATDPVERAAYASQQKSWLAVADKIDADNMAARPPDQTGLDHE